MAYISCKRCGCLVPESDNICCECGAKITHPFGYYFRRLFSLLVKFAILGGVVFAAYRYMPGFHEQLYQRNLYALELESDSLMSQTDSLVVQPQKVRPKYKKKKRYRRRDRVQRRRNRKSRRY